MFDTVVGFSTELIDFLGNCGWGWLGARTSVFELKEDDAATAATGAGAGGMVSNRTMISSSSTRSIVSLCNVHSCTGQDDEEKLWCWVGCFWGKTEGS